LEWVTNSENQIHAHKNGLKANGNKLWNGKFSKEQIEQIKKLKKSGMLQYKIAELMKTTKGTISEILSNKRYKYV
jgi:ribosomal protein L11